jgi:hypothetical protein
MANKLQDRNVYQPRELQILRSALRGTSRLIQEKYGNFGAKLQTVQLVAAAAIFDVAKTGDFETEHLVEAGAESVRMFLKQASYLRRQEHASREVN